MTDRSLVNTLVEYHPIFIPYVMIIESDQELATMLQRALKQEMKIGTIFARTMSDALNIARALCPSLFLINTHLTGGDGLTLVDLLRQNSILASVPVVLLTTDAHSYQRQAETRRITCLHIPAELDSILSTIKDHLPTHNREEESITPLPQMQS
ncbi:MAG: response regulator [Ktedonobacteraceae bacterium]|nr:response regulator [Ktedonobacteraceae bacterium]